MEEFKNYWNDVYSYRKDAEIIYDNWLDKYLPLFKNCQTKILDLGCGAGNDTLYLLEKGFKVISCDYAENALENLKRNIPQVETLKLDMTQILPFYDEVFDIIIADLSLHYFDDSTTKRIMLEIKRILKNDGHLLARVNSIKDINHGANQGKELEKHYFYVEGYNKRFFDLKDAEYYFSKIGTVSAIETQMLRYEKPKEVIEINTKKQQY